MKHKYEVVNSCHYCDRPIFLGEEYTRESKYKTRCSCCVEKPVQLPRFILDKLRELNKKEILIEKLNDKIDRDADTYNTLHMQREVKIKQLELANHRLTLELANQKEYNLEMTTMFDVMTSGLFAPMSLGASSSSPSGVCEYSRVITEREEET